MSNAPYFTKESRDKYLCQCGQFTDRSKTPLDPFNAQGTWNCQGCGNEFTVGDRMRAQEKINRLKDETP